MTTNVSFGPYQNDIFSEILLDKTDYIKNCFNNMLNKGYFSQIAHMNSIEKNFWIQDLSQIVKEAIWKLVINKTYIEKVKQKKYVTTIIWRKSDAENERLGKHISINMFEEEKDHEKI
jgi:hypothetical protein